MTKLAVSLGLLVLVATQAVAQGRPAYIVAEVDVTDQGVYQKYIDGATPVVKKFGGHFISRGDKIEEFAGAPPHRVAIYEFPSLAQAEAYRDSPDYKAIIPYRDKGSKYRAFIVDGIAP
jgi:uncharacterized protein (DUF1330 family)